MDTSLEVKLLIGLASVLTVSGFVLSCRASAQLRRLVTWIEAYHGERWEAVPWLMRQISQAAAVEALRQRGLGSDPEFARRYGVYKRSRRWIIALVIGGAAAIGITILGTKFGPWRW